MKPSALTVSAALACLIVAAQTHAGDHAALCDEWGAMPGDPALPATVEIRYYRTGFADNAAVEKAAAACTAAYEQHADVRYLFQRGVIRRAKTLYDERLALAQPSAPQDTASIRAHVRADAARSDLQQAADQGYAMALWLLAQQDISRIDSPEAFAARLPKEPPKLFRSGMANWYITRAVTHRNRTQEYMRELEKLRETALAQGDGCAYIWPVPRGGGALPDWREALKNCTEPSVYGKLAASFYSRGNHSEGDAVLTALPDTPDRAVETDFVQGARHLNGWGIAKDTAKGLELLKKAARAGHTEAMLILVGKKAGAW